MGLFRGIFRRRREPSVNEREFEGITIVQITGNIDLGPGEQVLDEGLSKAFRERKDKIVFDLTNLDYIADSPLGCLCRWYAKVINDGSQVRFVSHPSQREWPFMVMTGLRVENITEY